MSSGSGSNDTSNTSPKCNRLRISGPDDTYFLIEPYTDGYTWRIHSDALSATKNIRMGVTGVQSFHADKATFRESRPCNAPWPPIAEIEPGELSKREIFLTLESDCLRLGRVNRMGMLVWPSGDERLTQRWLIHTRVTGLSHEWRFQVNVTWTRGTRTIDLHDPEETPSSGHLPTRGPRSQIQDGSEMQELGPVGHARSTRKFSLRSSVSTASTEAT
jgi:hypothetical protein